MSTHNPKRLERADTRTELVDRLRHMRWPEPTPAARRRCWKALSAQVEALGEAPEPRDELHERRLRRHDFALPLFDCYAGALGQRAWATRGLSRVAFQ